MSGPIVMVDDSSQERRLAQFSFTQSKLSRPFHVFEDGRAFLEYLGRARSGVEEMPEVVLMDVKLSNETGFDVVAQAQSDENAASPRFVMLTNSNADVHRRRARDLGAEFHSKPTGVDGYIAFFESVVGPKPPGATITVSLPSSLLAETGCVVKGGLWVPPNDALPKRCLEAARADASKRLTIRVRCSLFLVGWTAGISGIDVHFVVAEG